MQYELFDDFKDGMVMTAIPLSWFKRVTEFIKGLGGGGVVKVRTENGAPNVTMDVSISQKANINTEMKPYKNEEGARVTDSPFDGDGENSVSWGINEENANDLNGCIVTLPTRFVHPTKTEEGEQVEDESKIRMFFRSFAKSPSGITAAITREIGYKDFCSIELNDDETVIEADGEESAGTSDDASRADHVHPLNVEYDGTPADVVKSTESASLGTELTYARTDHVHKMPPLDATDISYGTTTVAATLADHESRITAGSVTSVNGETGDVVLDAEKVGAVDLEDVGVTVQEHSSKLDTLDDNLTSAGKVPFSSIDGSISGHTGNCLLYVNVDGNIGHVGDGDRGNKVYSLVAGVNKSDSVNKIITDADIGNGLGTNGSNNLIVKCESGGGIEVGSDGLYLGDGAVLYDTSDIPTNALLTLDSDGFLNKKCAIPTQASSSDDKVLTIKKNTTTISWEAPTASTDAGNPSTSGSFPTNEVTQSAGTVWTSGGNNGICLNVMFNCSSEGTGTGHSLYVCKLTFSKSGLLTKVERVANTGVYIGA